jgi:hypothetical protein
MASHLGRMIRTHRIGWEDDVPFEPDACGDAHPDLDRDSLSVAKLDPTDCCLREARCLGNVALREAGRETSAANPNTQPGGYFRRDMADIAFHRRSLTMEA